MAPADDLAVLIPSWRRSLLAANKSPRTVTAYLEAATLLLRFLEEEHLPTRVGSIQRGHIEDWLAGLLEKYRPATASNRYRGARSFFKWAVDEGELAVSPMASMKPPHVPEEPPEVVSEADLKKLLKACEGREFDDRRDTAILMLFLDSGLRLSELAHLGIGDVDLDANTVTVLGKGRRPRTTAFGRRTAQALDRYLRSRASHRHSSLEDFWLGRAGAMTPSGIIQVLHRRCEHARISRFNVHRLRHVWAHQALASGMSESDVMASAGWRSAQMLRRYGASLAAERARNAQKRLSFVDRI